MESTGCYASWINCNNERHNLIIHDMGRLGIFIVINMKTNVAVQQRHQKKFIDAEYTVL